jgi:hypothetical protein
MPRGTATEIGSSIRELQQRARDVVRTLQREIRATAAELRRLRDEQSELARVAGDGGRARVRGATPGRAVRRINWRTVLARLPDEFKASQVRSVPELADKHSSEIFAGITRWMEAGLVKRKERGPYRRVGKMAVSNRPT